MQYSSSSPEHFAAKGWARSGQDAKLLAWVESVRDLSQTIYKSPANAHWWRHDKTWFVGVNVLPNDVFGKVPQGLALGHNIQRWLRQCLQLQNTHRFAFEQGQLSVIGPSYPQQDKNETRLVHNFRRLRDAAHVDGLLPVGIHRRRMPQEFHQFILGIPLQLTPRHAGTTVVWEGSHTIIQEALTKALKGIAPHQWPHTDVTEIYQQARQQVLACCKRVEIHTPPGEAYLIHRLAVHGVAPWHAQPEDKGKLRPVVFFRPEYTHTQEWLTKF